MADMTEILDITPALRYCLEEQNAARLSLSKSPFFLVLGLAPDLGGKENPVPEILTTCAEPELVLKIVQLESAGKRLLGTEKFRLLLQLSTRNRPKSRVAVANRIVSAIGFLFAHVQWGLYGDLRPYQIPKELITGTTVSAELLEELEALTGTAHPNGFRNELHSFFSIAPPHAATVFYLLPFVLQDEDLFNACAFFRSCCSECSFSGGLVRDILDQPQRGPDNEIQRLALEHVVLQSFRTVEAIAGEPGNNRKRFHERLKSWGLRPNERFGFTGRKHSLENRICWLQEARDSAAAHGKRRRLQPFTLVEAMEAQHIAHSVLDRALWWKADSLGRKGHESEIAFLLDEMLFPENWVLEKMLPHDPGWSRDKTLFNGKRAVDLARAPGGLTKIFRYRERQIRSVLAPRVQHKTNRPTKGDTARPDIR